MGRLSYPLGVLLLLVLMHGLTMPPVAAQMPWPLQGQNLPPPGITAIHVDVVMDTIQAINSDRNSWNAIHWVHLSWVDPRADQAIQGATEAWVAAAQANNGSFSTDADDGCKRPCDSSHHPTAGCCNRLWLPHVNGNNLVSLSQEANYHWRIWVDPPTTAAGTTTNSTRMVHWVARITAEWQSPFDFRAWPFEHQHLLMELSVASSLADRVYLKMGNLALAEHTPHNKGDDVPGWHVAKTTRVLYNSSACFTNTNATTLYDISTGKDTAVALRPLDPLSWAVLRFNLTAATDNGTTVTNIMYNCPSYFSAEATAQYGPQILVMDVMVRRTQLYYVLTNIVPLLLLDYMVFITYAMERSDLESRIGVVVTLVLAVSALQFTYSFPPASYLNAVQQITLMSHCLYFIVAIQSMVTAHICRLHARRRDYAKLVSISRLRQKEQGMSSDERGISGRPSGSPLAPIISGIPGLGRIKPMAIEESEDERPSVSVFLAGPPPSPGAGPPPSPGAGGSRAAQSQPSNARALRSQLYSMPTLDRESSGSHLSVTMRHGIPPGPVAEGLTTEAEGLNPTGTSDGWEALPKKKRGHWFSRFKKHETTPSIGQIKPSKRLSFDSRALKRMGSSIAGAAHKTRAMQQRIDADEAFAQLVAARLDQIFSWSLLVAFTITVAVLLYVNQLTGDHKLMLSGKPANF